MKRYIVIGIYDNGKALVIKTGRGQDPNNILSDAVCHSQYHGHPYKTILLVDIGEAENVSGARLNMSVHEVDVKPPPTYVLRPAERRR